MLSNFILELKNLKEDFNKEEIIFYQLLFIQCYKIIGYLEINDINDLEKNELVDELTSFLENFNLLQTIDIEMLNNLFNPLSGKIDIQDKNIFITLYNIYLDELRHTDNIFSKTILDISKQIIDLLQDSSNENLSSEKENFQVEYKESDCNINLDLNYNQDYLDFEDFEIVNKEYLKEYIMRKNLKPYKCNLCGLSAWQNNPLILYLHSKNNIYSNRNLENLEFLCPNCYSLIGE